MMKKNSSHVPALLLVIIVLVAFGYIFYSSFFAVFCDGLALHFYQIFEQRTPSELSVSFAHAIAENTEILEDCMVVSYAQAPQSDLHDWLKKYDIKKYDVKYKCDILSFNLDIYELGNKFYTLSYEMGPCSEENVYFDRMPENTVETWYHTKYSLENAVISDHLDNSTFYAALKKKVDGKNGN
jgi:hypothetical protein